MPFPEPWTITDPIVLLDPLTSMTTVELSDPKIAPATKEFPTPLSIMFVVESWVFSLTPVQSPVLLVGVGGIGVGSGSGVGHGTGLGLGFGLGLGLGLGMGTHIWGSSIEGNGRGVGKGCTIQPQFLGNSKSHGLHVRLKSQKLLYDEK